MLIFKKLKTNEIEIVLNCKTKQKINISIPIKYEEYVCFNKNNFNKIKYEKSSSTNTDKMKNINGFNFEAKTDLFKLFSCINLNNICIIDLFLFKKFCKKYVIKCKKSPDEIILSDKNIYIIEKKFQKVSGSVYEKLFLTNFYYEYFSSKFLNVQYVLVLNQFLYSQLLKQTEMNQYFKLNLNNNISIFNGDDENYFKNILEFISRDCE
jgi:hypothetical protein